MLREVILHGELARRYGKVHRFAVASAAEAIAALKANYTGFEAYLMNSHTRGVAYNLWVGGENVGQEELRQHSSGRIYISPCVMGSKRGGLLQTILGAALITVGVLITVGTFGGGTPLGVSLIASGATMFVSGVAALLTPLPKSGNSQQVQSNYFDGAQNTTAQGNPVPVGYGTMLIGGAVISAGISIDQVAVTAA